MKKLKLKLETLAVQSFATGDSAGAGTVRGHDVSEVVTCDCSLNLAYGMEGCAGDGGTAAGCGGGDTCSCQATCDTCMQSCACLTMQCTQKMTCGAGYTCDGPATHCGTCGNCYSISGLPGCICTAIEPCW